MKITRKARETFAATWLFLFSLIAAMACVIYVNANMEPGTARWIFLTPTILTFSFIGITIAMEDFKRIRHNRRSDEDRITDLEARVAELEGRED